MPQRIGRIFAVVFLISLSACGLRFSDRRSPPSVSARDVDAALFQTKVFDLTDEILSELAWATEHAVRATDNPQRRADIQARLVEAASALLAISASPAPDAAFLDLYADIHVRRAVTARWLAGTPDDAPERAILRKLDEACVDIDRLGSELLQPQMLVRARELTSEWVARNPDRESAGAVRFEEFWLNRGGGLRVANDRSLFAPFLLADMTNTTNELGSTRLTGERMLFVLQRMPTLLLWHSQLLVFRTLADPQVEHVLAQVDLGVETVHQLSASIDHATETARDIRAAVLDGDGLDAGAIATAASDIRATVADARAALPEAQATIAELRSAIVAANEVATTIADLSKGSDGPSFDMSTLPETTERIATASADLRKAIETASALLSSEDATRRFEEIARSSRASVDHVAWRLGQLLVIAGSLAVVLRIVWVITRQRAEAAARASRR